MEITGLKPVILSTSGRSIPYALGMGVMRRWKKQG